MTNPVPFTNHIGQTINVGDKVLAVSVSTQSYCARDGVYVGLSASGFPQVRRNIQKWGAWYKGTETRAEWPYAVEDIDYKHVNTESVGTLLLGRVYALKEA
jgi:hypothetical protein